MNHDGDDNDDNNLRGGAFGAGGGAAGDDPQDDAQDNNDNDDNNAEVEDDDDDDDDDGMDRDENRVLDGGVAGTSNNSSNNDDSSTAAPRRRAADCDIILYITCSETMEDLVPNHSVLKEGVVVSIGLDKNTKLGAVFSRYTEFCNENSNLPTERVEESDLEFFHCQLLNSNDTAESSALMKNDRIKVRRERAAERETQAELKRIQRESDKEYFKELRNLMPDRSYKNECDLIIDCQGTHSDGGRKNKSQQVLNTMVRGHASILSKRCKWLGSLIKTAREEKKATKQQQQQSIDTIVTSEKQIEPESPQSDDQCMEEQFPKGNIVANTSATLPEDNEQPQNLNNNNDDMMEEDDDDDDGIAVVPLPGGPHNIIQPQQPLQQPLQIVRQSGATEIIEDDDDNEDESLGLAAANRRSSSAESVKTAKPDTVAQDDEDKLWVTVNHTPEAVKILMEYCYTNRVISLGHDAFVLACRTKPVKPNGPVSPYSSTRRWPNMGLPDVSFAAALDGISLAEEAGMPRLSLMCEVAASLLVRDANCVEALSKCTLQKELTGNDLPRLREAAISVVIRCGPCGVYDSGRFREALEGRTTSIIPALFTGTVEAIANNEKQDKHKSDSRKRNRGAISESYLDELDREDQYRRDKERRNRRIERNPELAASAGHIVDSDERGGGDVFVENVSSSWASETARRSLKRMSQHLNVPGFQVGRSYSSREVFNSRVSGSSYGGSRSRRRSSRRSSDRS